MPNPRFQKSRIKRTHKNLAHNDLEFSEELTHPNFVDFQMQPVPQPKDFEEIEY